MLLLYTNQDIKNFHWWAKYDLIRYQIITNYKVVEKQKSDPNFWEVVQTRPKPVWVTVILDESG